MRAQPQPPLGGPEGFGGFAGEQGAACRYLDPVTWLLYGLIEGTVGSESGTVQLGDGGSQPLSTFLHDQFLYEHVRRPAGCPAWAWEQPPARHAWQLAACGVAGAACVPAKLARALSGPAALHLTP